MCLAKKSQNTERTFEILETNGRLCTKSQEFLNVGTIFNDDSSSKFQPNGVLGLAPGGGDQSFISQLKVQGSIQRELVGLNLEDTLDTTLSSTITFGELQYTQVVNGEVGLTHFSNVGQDSWGLIVDKILYGGDLVASEQDKLSKHTLVNAKVAYIDTANSTIQLPASLFNIVADQIRGGEKTVVADKLPNGKNCLISSSKCSEIRGSLKKLQF
mmetsp:Transcript_14385/g.24503  ORF Transcript_14385/g.24503 Transcript_14385/m.24503 type:complete len:214 (+) Transcript_14385:439-1080(+)